MHYHQLFEMLEKKITDVIPKGLRLSNIKKAISYQRNWYLSKSLQHQIVCTVSHWFEQKYKKRSASCASLPNRMRSRCMNHLLLPPGRNVGIRVRLHAVGKVFLKFIHPSHLLFSYRLYYVWILYIYPYESDVTRDWLCAVFKGYYY